jgi:hypothetical protein
VSLLIQALPAWMEWTYEFAFRLFGRSLGFLEKKMEVMKMKLWDRVQRGMEAGFDSALSAVHAITEKAGEGIELTRLRREKARLETEVTRNLAKLGNAVYEKISTERLEDISDKLEVKDILQEIAESEARMVDIDRRLTKELESQDKVQKGQ